MPGERWLWDQPKSWHAMNRALHDIDVLLNHLNELPDSRLLSYFKATQDHRAAAMRSFWTGWMRLRRRFRLAVRRSITLRGAKGTRHSAPSHSSTGAVTSLPLLPLRPLRVRSV